MTRNIFRCRFCGRFGTSEEANIHECRPLTDYKIVGKSLLVFDGKEWYPLKFEDVYPTFFDNEKFRHRLDRT